MSDKTIVRFCSPTLAGLKVASLFTYKFNNKSQLCRDIKRANRRLQIKGIKFQILNIFNNLAIIYVYRISKLQIILENKEIEKFLSTFGYRDFDIVSCLKNLSLRMRENNNFPHEIGIFLGYPLKDTIAFIENKGKNYLCSGYWKVYNNETEAIKIFARYKKCTEIYCKKHAQGTCMEKLAIS